MALIGKGLLVAGALVFWGLQTQYLWLSVVLAAIIIASRVVKQHLSFTGREFARLWDVTMLVLVGAAVYQRQTSSISGAVLSFLQWLPILFFPLMAAFAFSDVGKLPYSTFVFWWRERDKARAVDFTYVYLGICLLAASASANRTAWFYAAAAGLIAAGLWFNRPRRIGTGPTLALLAVTGAAGFFLQAEWRDLHSELESKTMTWFAGFFPRPFEDQETYTSLGDVTKLRNSGRVLMRIETAVSSAQPRLLRQVSFDQYRRDSWLGTRRVYAPVAEASPGRWDLSPGDSATNSARLCIVVPETRILLPLPAGAARARNLVAARLERNRFGNVRVWDCADPLQCWIDFDGIYSNEPAPSAKDLQVPGADEAAVREVVEELGLLSMPRRDGGDFLCGAFSV
jgi:protein-glutamine gamma-glutamyltransferase